MYASVDDYGFLVTPYRPVTKGKLAEEVEAHPEEVWEPRWEELEEWPVE